MAGFVRLFLILCLCALQLTEASSLRQGTSLAFSHHHNIWKPILGNPVHKANNIFLKTYKTPTTKYLSRMTVEMDNIISLDKTYTSREVQADFFDIPARDGHILRVWSKSPIGNKRSDQTVLLLHGRTWSSIPVYQIVQFPLINFYTKTFNLVIFSLQSCD